MINQFNHEAVARITRETIEHSLTFFDVINERLIEITKAVRPDMPLPRLVEETNKVCETFLNEHRQLLTRAENVWRETFATVTDPKNRPATDTTVTPINNIFDPNELLRYNRDVMNTTIGFFTKAGEQVFKAFDPQHPVTTPRNVADLLNTIRDEYVRRHQELVQQIETTLRRAIDLNRPTTTEHPVNESVNRPLDITEIVRTNREVIDHTVRFFVELNTNILDIVAHLDRPETVRNHIETLTHTCEEYRRIHQTALETIINTTRETLEQAIVNQPLKNHPINTVINRDELFKVNQETIAITVKFFLDLNDELIRAVREPGKPVNLDTLVTGYQRNHHILASRITAIWQETLNRLHTIETPELREQTIGEAPKNTRR
ncbi:MAG TPA: hypothetical protein VIV61_07160 [Candidatus Ozemobacteraceae bacterium]